MTAAAAQIQARWAALAAPLARLSRGRRAFLAFVLLIACLAGWICWECLRPLHRAAAEQIAPPTARPLSLPVATPIPSEAVTALQQRVLFKARNPAAADSGLQVTAQELLKKLQLRGMSRQGEAWVAYVQVQGEGIKRAAAGDKIGEFTVERVEERRVYLKLATEQVVLGF